jgi:hypothetical protein
MELMEVYHEAMATWIIARVTGGMCEGAKFVFDLIESAIRKEATSPFRPLTAPAETNFYHRRTSEKAAGLA